MLCTPLCNLTERSKKKKHIEVVLSMSNYSWVDFKAPCESFYNKMRKKLQFLRSILINWNYPGWSLFPNSILGREYLKAINEFINKKEHTLRRKSICSFKTDCPLDIGKKGMQLVERRTMQVKLFMNYLN